MTSMIANVTASLRREEDDLPLSATATDAEDEKIDHTIFFSNFCFHFA